MYDEDIVKQIVDLLDEADEFKAFGRQLYEAGETFEAEDYSLSASKRHLRAARLCAALGLQNPRLPTWAVAAVERERSTADS